jgi:hypothetical protein
MDCHACEIIHVVGPYFLVAFFAIVLYRLVRRHHDEVAQMHERAMDAFERQNATYERVHFDLVAIKKRDAAAAGENDGAPTKN